MPRPALFALVALCALAARAPAQPGTGKLPAKFAKLADVDVTVTPAKAKWGETVTVRLTVKPKGDGYTYPAFPKDPTQSSKNEVAAPAPADLVFIGTVRDPALGWKEKPRDETKPDGPKDQYTREPVTWEFKAVVSPKAKAGTVTVALPDVSIQVCDQSNCYPVNGNRLPTAALEVVEGASDKVVPEDLASALEVLKVQKVAPPVVPGKEKDDDKGKNPQKERGPETGVKSETRKVYKDAGPYKDELEAIRATVVQADEGAGGTGSKQTGLWAFVFTAAAWGLISLVTPCVFPMIPITVSIFLKQAHGSLRERLKLAGVYCLTIISVLGVSAFALLKFMAWLSAHPVTNVLLAVLFLVLALSLFGMYEIALPNSLQKRLQAKQSKGGVVGTIFGALAFTVISFTCVAPFLGGFAGISAGNDGGGSLISLPTWKEIAGGLAFATAFAAPFFVLALVPGLMKALPKSGGWLDSVKVVMGFLELAAALKFLRTAELRVFPTPQYFTYDVVLGGWVAISAACGLYLLNVFRLPHDEERPNIGVPRLLFALMFLGLALHLAPGLMKGPDGKPQRPAGTVYAWVESFLLPESEPWPTDLGAAVVRSKDGGKPVFVDFTGVTCTNCKYNEEHIFSRPEFRSLFDQFEKVQLYTDEVPAVAYKSDPLAAARKQEARANREFQIDVFGDSALPLYAVLIPTADKKLKVFKYTEGKINEPEKFSAFLQSALKASEEENVKIRAQAEAERNAAKKK